ncbi:cupin domain-containing protein [Cupriavidus sp. NPDC089707]|uniref:cupin domain-containing protein n=1 Tax=Cupriavidus sp. NPDC089707 TaxID=3363963 RepID=UPI003830300A
MEGHRPVAGRRLQSRRAAGLASGARGALLIAGSSLPLLNAQAQTDIQRTDLVHHALSIPGRDAIQVHVDFDPGAFAPKHSHPGEEIAYVLQGTLEYQLDDKPPVTLKAGEALFIPAGSVHPARNVGSGKAPWAVTRSSTISRSTG